MTFWLQNVWCRLTGKNKKKTEPVKTIKTVVVTEFRQKPSENDINAFLHITQLYPDAVKWWVAQIRVYGLHIPRYRIGHDCPIDNETRSVLIQHKEYILGYLDKLPQVQYEFDHPLAKDSGTARLKEISLPLGVEETADWPWTEDGVRYRYLYDYMAVKYDREFTTPAEQKILYRIKEVRRKVWSFKYDLENPKPVKHATVVEDMARQIAGLLNNTFPLIDRDEIIFVCCPASSQLSYLLRFREFSALVCRLTDMIDGMAGIHIIGEKTPKHKGGKSDIQMVVDEEMFFGKNVILFDDVLTTGGTVKKYTAYFNRLKVHVIGAVFIARTLTPEDIVRLKSQSPE